MKPIERVSSAMSFEEPDRVPLIQSLSFYGAKELGMEIKDYFSNPEKIVEAQLLMQKKYHNDCLIGTSYASAEFEAFGGKTIFAKEGPPNAGMPVIRSVRDIEKLREPNIEECAGLQRILETIRLLKQESNGDLPVLGGVISPFSLPVMQMGFEHYLNLIIGNTEAFQKLMNVNKTFCIKWANLQLEAGATAVGYADPVSSPTIITRQMYRQTGWPIAKEVLAAINGTTAIHFASGATIPVIDELAETKTSLIAVSSREDIGEVKRLANSRMAIMGNLNGIEMCRWDKHDAENAIKNIIRKAGKGGGLLISDTHGEIPYQVPQEVLLAIADSVEKYGVYQNN